MSPIGSGLGSPQGDASPPNGAAQKGRVLPALGYMSLAADGAPDSLAPALQAHSIEHACRCRGLGLVELVHDVEPAPGEATSRPGLQRALERISRDEASCLVVAGIDRVAPSAAALGGLLEWFERHGARLILPEMDLDTATATGGLAARALIAAGELQRDKLRDRTRRGLAAARANGMARGRPAVADRPELEKRIRALRAEGMTLQAIADLLNAERVPTLRGGAEWRPSSVQAAAGYRRPGRNRGPTLPGPALVRNGPAA